MFCNYCGKPNPDDAGFCSSCGKPIVHASAPPVQPPAPIAPPAPPAAAQVPPPTPVVAVPAPPTVVAASVPAPVRKKKSWVGRELLVIVGLFVAVVLIYPHKDGNTICSATQEEVVQQVPYAIDILADRHPIIVNLVRALLNDKGALDRVAEDYVRSSMQQQDSSALACYAGYYIVLFNKNEVRNAMADKIEKDFNLANLGSQSNGSSNASSNASSTSGGDSGNGAGSGSDSSGSSNGESGNSGSNSGDSNGGNGGNSN